ncbi:hypothetical protein [Lysinibacillus sp. LZ02]|uniref:hypothetical protein n=1 Tax=Lysinibacillus sp. LZ02 TaxID=3420668 RepID=UPI003D36F14E
MSVAVAEFKSALTQIKEHHKSGNLGSYRPMLKAGLKEEDLENFPELKSITKEYQGNLNSFKSEEETHINGKMEVYKDSQDSGKLDAFKAAMDARKEKAKEDSAKMIDSYYDKLIQVGTDHPEQVDVILGLADFVMGFMKDIFNKISEIVVQVVRVIVEAIEKAFEFVKNAFNSVTGAIASLF